MALDGINHQETETRIYLLWNRPTAYLLSFRFNQAASFALGAALIYFLSDTARKFDTYGSSTYRNYRVVSDSNYSLQLKRKGCEIQVNGSEILHSPRMFSFDRPVTVDGYSILASHNRSAVNISHIKIEGLDEGTDTWVIVASCRFRFLQDRIRFLSGPCSEPKPSVDLRAPWPLKITVAIDTTLGVGFMLFSLCGVLGAPAQAHILLIVMLVLVTCLKAVTAASFLAVGFERESVPYAIHSLLSLLCTLALRYAEQLVPAALVLAGALGVLARMLSDCAGFDDCAYLRESPPVEYIILSCFGGILLAQRWRVTLASVRAIRADRAAYDSAWRPLAASERAELDRLAAIAAAIAISCPRGAARQLCLVGQPSQVPGGNPTGQADSAGGRPVASLSQLYAQAVGLVSVLAARCDAWAATSGGAVHCAGPAAAASGSTGGRRRFRPRGGVGGESDDDALALSRHFGPACEKWVQRGCLKAPRRAMGKMVARQGLGGDPSRLLDLCRSRIVFDRVAGLLACLEAIHDDPFTQVTPLARETGKL